MLYDKYTDAELLQAIEAETAKSIGEIKCALGDLDKAINRLRFVIGAVHTIKQRKEER